MAAEGAKKNHILITGGRGFIGGYLANHLNKSGFKVTTISRGTIDNERHLCADLTNEDKTLDLAKRLPPVDTIIHCAAIAHGEKPPGDYSVADFNTLIVENIIKAFAENDPHWIFMSSISVYGDFHSELSIPITREPKPIDSYGIGKLRDERLFISNCHNIDILRLMPVYAKNNLRDIRKRVFIPYTNFKISLRPAPLYSICSLDKVLTAIEGCMKRKPSQRIIQVGDPLPVSQADFLAWFAGRPIPVPQLILRFIVFILPKRFSFLREISFMIKKFGLNNIYDIGSIDLTKNRCQSNKFEN